jgi:hypothetical protein
MMTTATASLEGGDQGGGGEEGIKMKEIKMKVEQTRVTAEIKMAKMEEPKTKEENSKEMINRVKHHLLVHHPESPLQHHLLLSLQIPAYFPNSQTLIWIAMEYLIQEITALLLAIQIKKIVMVMVKVMFVML